VGAPWLVWKGVGRDMRGLRPGTTLVHCQMRQRVPAPLPRGDALRVRAQQAWAKSGHGKDKRPACRPVTRCGIAGAARQITAVSLK
jgi:hypothetical protein